MSNPLRPALPSDAEFVHANLKVALAETFGAVPQFVKNESARFSTVYLRALIAANPAYVFIMENAGKRAGFMVSGPEHGSVVLYWSFIDPAHRKGNLALSCMSNYVKHWDNNRFHKIASYTTAENRVAQLLMRRNGFREIVKLEKHVLGQDLILFERPLNKALEGYDPPVTLNGRALLLHSVKRRLHLT